MGAKEFHGDKYAEKECANDENVQMCKYENE